jgi:hypothetical protein
LNTDSSGAFCSADSEVTTNQDTFQKLLDNNRCLRLGTDMAMVDVFQNLNTRSKRAKAVRSLSGRGFAIGALRGWIA